jgi:hypothetical protein
MKTSILLGRARIRLKAGDHVFPFSLVIPYLPSLPGSFKSQFGQILYQLGAYVQVEFGLDSKAPVKAERVICVHSYMNLSSLNKPSLMQPVCYEKSEKNSSSSFSWKTTPHLKFKFKMPQSCYVAGEDIPFELEVDKPSSSSYEIEGMTLSIIQNIHYNATFSWGKLKQRIVCSKERTRHMDTTPNVTLWTGKFPISHSARPSHGKDIIEISYAIRVILYLRSDYGLS